MNESIQIREAQAREHASATTERERLVNLSNTLKLRVHEAKAALSRQFNALSRHFNALLTLSNAIETPLKRHFKRNFDDFQCSVGHELYLLDGGGGTHAAAAAASPPRAVAIPASHGEPLPMPTRLGGTVERGQQALLDLCSIARLQARNMDFLAADWRDVTPTPPL